MATERFRRKCEDSLRRLEEFPESGRTIPGAFPLPALVRAVTVEGAGYLNFHFDRGAVTARVLAADLLFSAPGDRHPLPRRLPRPRAHPPGALVRPRSPPRRAGGER